MTTPRRRPPFVVSLCAAAAVVVVFEMVRQIQLPFDSYRRAWLGLRLAGWPAICASTLDVALCAVGGWGLWNLRPWARLLAMGYLGVTLASFLLVGVEAFRGGRILAVMAWQMFVLPFATFCFMYLHGGKRYFR